MPDRQRHPGAAALLAGLLLTLTGCDQFWSSDAEKINQAIRLSRDARAALKALAQEAPAEARESVGADVAARLEQRALSCADGYAPGWLTTVEEIRGHFRDRFCFAEADDKLVRWVGERRASILLALEPLRPVPTQVPRFIFADEPIIDAVFPAESGVALLKLPGSVQIVDLANSETISETAVNYSLGLSMAPNGRLFTLNTKEGTEVRKAADGDLLFSVNTQGGTGLHWLTDELAIEDDLEGGPWLVDFRTGDRTRVPGMRGNVLDVIAIPGTTDEWLAAVPNRISRLRISRTEGVATAEYLDDKPNSRGSWCTVSAGDDQAASHLVYSGPDAGAASMLTLERRSLGFGNFYVNGCATTREPDLVVLRFFRPASGDSQHSVLYSFKRRSITPIDTGELGGDKFVSIPALRSFGVIQDAKIRVVSDMAADLSLGETLPVEQFIADLEADLTRPRIVLDQQQLERSPTVAERTPKDSPIFQAAQRARIDAVGVYEAANQRVRAGQDEASGGIRVVVRASDQPVLLVLASNGTVQWFISRMPGAELAGVALYGTGRSSVVGADDAPVFRSGQLFAYERTSPQFERLNADVVRQAGKPIRNFQGRYAGSTFTVGGY